MIAGRHIATGPVAAAAADASMGAMRAVVRGFERLGTPVASTARPFSFYRRVLFGGASEEEVLRLLHGKRIVDVGCGLTPFVEDSMFQVCRRRGIEFYGVDPKLARGFAFGLGDRISARMTGAGSRPRRDMPGLERALAARAERLPFDDASVDRVLSNWLLFAWIRDDAALAAIFREFDRVLRPGGEIVVYPALRLDRLRADYPELTRALAGYALSEQLVVGGLPGSLPVGRVLRARKA